MRSATAKIQPAVEAFTRKLSGLRHFGSSFGGARKQAAVTQAVDLSSRLDEFSRDLEAVCKAVEPDFLQLGQALQTAFAEANELAAATMNTVELIGGDSGESVLSKINTLVGGSLASLDDCRSGVSGNIARFEVENQHLEALFKQCQLVEKMSMVLRVVGLNIGIESSRSPEARDMFAIVAAEVRDLAQKIITIAGQIRDDSRDTQQNQETTLKTVSAGMQQMSILAGEAHQAVEEAADQIKSLMQWSLTAMNQAGEHSEEISRQVGEVVVGIQFHDNMSQRIAHIAEALRDIGRLTVQTKSRGRASKPDPRQMAKAHAIVQLQIAQLHQVGREVQTVYDTNCRAFDQINRHIGDLAHSLAVINGSGHQTTRPTGGTTAAPVTAITAQNDSDTPDGMPTTLKTGLPSLNSPDPFDDLNAALQRLHDLVQSGGERHDQIAATMARASEAAKRLSDYAVEVRKINIALHIMALNSSVKAAHMGDQGRALEVLAQEVKHLSDQSNMFVSRINEILGAIRASAQAEAASPHVAPSDSSDESSIESAVESAGADRQFEAEIILDGMQELNRTYETFKDDATRAVEQSDRLAGEIAQTRNELDFLKGLIEAYDRQMQVLLSISDELSPYADQLPEGAVDEARELARRYTMDQERLVHEDQLGLSQTGPDKSPRDHARTEANRPSRRVATPALKDNLVQAVAGTAAGGAIATGIDDAVAAEAEWDGDIELFDDIDLQPDSENEHDSSIVEPLNVAELADDTDADDFGDNVDLF